jgi:hypothetical protein
MGVTPTPGSQEPIACSLGAADLPGRLAEWQEVLRDVVERTPLDGGIRLAFGPDAPMEEVVRLAGAEHDCCRFFSFAVTIDGRGRALEVTAGSDAMEVVTALFGPAG